jgi:hypothetical protein
MVISMNTRSSTPNRRSGISFGRVVRAFVEASLVALAFGVAILLVGAPIALLARALHGGLSWLAGGTPLSPSGEALVAAATIVVGLVLAGALVRALVGLRDRRARARSVAG